MKMTVPPMTTPTQTPAETPAPTPETSPVPLVLESIPALRAAVANWRRTGQRIALVPTMGALHEGHLTLVREGLRRADRVIATIFVNPAQFGPNEDYDAYPRTWEADLEKLAAAGAAAVFRPGRADMYPPGFATTVSVGGVTAPLEGECRPGHFDGVATVVAKLLLQAQPDIALFGEKDYQQLQLIKKLAADLDIPAEIAGVPTVRDANGLALSSRNAYLSPAQYEIACALNRILSGLAAAIRENPAADIQALEDGARRDLLSAGFDSVDYIAVRDARTLETIYDLEYDKGATRPPLRVLAAARLGRARLIDNVPV